jgi:hypothetical protein
MDNTLLQPETVKHLLNCVRYRRAQLSKDMWKDNKLVERSLLDQISQENNALIDIEVELEIMEKEFAEVAA